VRGQLEAFRQGLKEYGWVEGQNIIVEYRFAEGKEDALPAIAAELARLRLDVIVAEGTAAIQAAKTVTQTVPIVMATLELAWSRTSTGPAGTRNRTRSHGAELPSAATGLCSHPNSLSQGLPVALSPRLVGRRVSTERQPPGA
jgi:hypothetical protein